MRRVIPIMIVVFTIAHNAMAAGPFRFGLEWGLSVNFHNTDDVTFVNGEGSVVTMSLQDSEAGMNGEVLGYAALDFAGIIEAALLGGYAGIRNGLRMYEAEGRVKIFVKKGFDKGFFTSAGGGLVFRGNCEDGYYGRLGPGYRFYIGNGSSIDIKADYRLVSNHPYNHLFDPLSSRYIDRSSLRSADSLSHNMVISIALVF